MWAFGAVLYEMLSGQRAFRGDDIADTIAAVLRQDIDWTVLPASTPASVRRLIARCLDRDVRWRLRDIGEARVVLEDPAVPARGEAEGMPALAPSRPMWQRAIPIMLSAIAAGVLASAATVYLRHTPEPLVVTRFALTLAEGQTINPQTARKAVALSPDGTLMAYAANQRLYLRSMSELEARPIASAEIGRVVTSPVFSPDSRSVVFSSDSALKKVAVSGGAAVTICPVDQTFGVSWDASGILFGLDHKGIMRVSANGGTPEVLVSVKDGEQVYGPQMLPGGDTVLFTLATGAAADRWDKAQIVTQSLRTGERKTLVDGGSDGRYVQDKKPTPFADVQSPNPINAAFSPDGRWVAYTVFEGAVTGIYVQPFPATGAKYAVSKSSAIAPVWSRDGRELLSQPPGGHGAVQTITTQPSFSSTPPVPVPRGGAFTGGVTGERNYDVMPDGRTLGVVSAGQTESAGATTPPIQVVLHWFEELKQRLPTK